MALTNFANNLFNVTIKNIIENGSVNFGNSIQKGFSANTQSTGGQSVIGNLSASYMTDWNIVSDPDVVDQPQIQI